MELTGQQIKELYQQVIKPFGHPDPVGFLVRAINESGADPDYFDPDGKIGFMPVDPALILDNVGTVNLTDLQSNVMATMTLDMMYFQRFKSINQMIIAFHFGEDEAIGYEDNPKYQKFIAQVNEDRKEILPVIDPRPATVNDVVAVMNEGLRNKGKQLSLEEVIKEILED